MTFSKPKMIFASALIPSAIALSTALSFADNACSSAPKSKYQDRAKLDDLLKPNGLMISKITDEHGCYKVVAVTRKFEKAILFFNAETLKQVEMTSSDPNDPKSKDTEIDGD